MKYDIEKLTGGIYLFNKELADGSIVVYNKSHDKQTRVAVTDQLNDATNLTRRGWSLLHCDNGYMWRAPEESLVDLSELYHNPTNSPKEILAYFRLMKSLEPKRMEKHIEDAAKNTGQDGVAAQLSGMSVEAEFRVSCSSTCLLSALKSRLFCEIKEAYPEEWKVQLSKAGKEIHDRTIRIKREHVYENSGLMDAYYRWQGRYNALNVGKLPEPEAIYGIWKHLNAENYDKHLFVLGHGLKYAIGFLKDIGAESKVSLCEAHTGFDPRKTIFFDPFKDYEGKKIAIVDKVYTGNTLKLLSEKLAEFNPSVVAMFPKSRMLFDVADHVFFLDRMVEPNSISRKDDWCEKLFIDVANTDGHIQTKL